MARLAEMLGYRAFTLRGGYKAFRNYVLESFLLPRPLLVLGGYSGSGKTDILTALAQQGEQTIDMEGAGPPQGISFWWD
jgi:tRNA 2-selenouridine synthase